MDICKQEIKDNLMLTLRIFNLYNNSYVSFIGMGYLKTQFNLQINPKLKYIINGKLLLDITIL